MEKLNLTQQKRALINQKKYNTTVMGAVLVSWSLMSLFSTNMAISETKGQGWKVIRTQ